MSISARVRAPVSYREWLAKVQVIWPPDAGWYYALQHYSWQSAWMSGLTPEQAVKDCKGWLYG